MRLFVLPVVALLLFAIIIDIVIYRRIVRHGGKYLAVLRAVHLAAVAVGWLSIATIFAAFTGKVPMGMIMMAILAVLVLYVSKLAYSITHGLLWLASLLCKSVGRSTEWVSSAVGVAVLGCMLWGVTVTPYSVDLREVEYSSARVPAGFDGYRIVQISDAHLGTFAVDTRFVAKAVAAINAAKPDLVCFTGDLVNSLASEAEPHVASLSGIEADVVSVLGNHDYGLYYRWESEQAQRDNLQRLKDLQTKDLGWRLLLNEHITLYCGGDSIVVAGVENWGEPPFPQYGDLASACAGVNDSTFVLLLSHNPKHWRAEVLPQSSVDLMLAGHTHAMQMVVNLPWSRWSPSVWRYSEWGGMYKDADDRALYVNTGLGEVGIPMRVGVAPEITVITLRHK